MVTWPLMLYPIYLLLSLSLFLSLSSTLYFSLSLFLPLSLSSTLYFSLSPSFSLSRALTLSLTLTLFRLSFLPLPFNQCESQPTHAGPSRSAPSFLRSEQRPVPWTLSRDTRSLRVNLINSNIHTTVLLKLIFIL